MEIFKKGKRERKKLILSFFNTLDDMDFGGKVPPFCHPKIEKRQERQN